VRILAREKAAEQMPLYPKSLIPSTATDLQEGALKASLSLSTKPFLISRQTSFATSCSRWVCPRFGYRRQSVPLSPPVPATCTPLKQDDVR